MLQQLLMLNSRCETHYTLTCSRYFSFAHFCTLNVLLLFLLVLISYSTVPRVATRSTNLLSQQFIYKQYKL